MSFKRAFIVTMLMLSCGKEEIVIPDPTPSAQPTYGGDAFISPLTIDTILTDFFAECLVSKKTEKDCAPLSKGLQAIFIVPNVLSSPTYAGVCITDLNTHLKTILLRASECPGSDSENSKNYLCRTLVYHEMGHCLLGYPHTDTGIMAPVLDYSLTQAQFEIYVQEFWTLTK